MTTALTVLENQLKPLAPRLEMVLDKRVPVDRLMQTIMISCERLPLLFDCDRQSLFNSAMSAAVLGLEVDGVTGQAYLIPFAGKAQLVIGYKGFNMQLAARMDEAVDEQGLAARIDPDRGVIVEGEIVEPSKTPTAEQLISPRPSVDAAGSAASSHETVDKPLESDAADDFSAAHAYVEKWRLICDGCHTAADASQVHGQWSREKEMRELIDWPADGTLSRLRTQVESTIKAARAK
jgi:hypothetical protein